MREEPKEPRHYMEREPCVICETPLNVEDTKKVELDDYKHDERVCEGCLAQYYNYDEFCDVYITKEI